MLRISIKFDEQASAQRDICYTAAVHGTDGLQLYGGYPVLTVVVILALLAAIGAMIIGLYSMGRGGSFDKKMSVPIMYLRIILQGVAVLFMLLALYLSKT